MTFRHLPILLLIVPVAFLLLLALRKPAARAVLYFPLANRKLKLSVRQLLLPVWIPFFLRLIGLFFLDLPTNAEPAKVLHQFFRSRKGQRR